MTQLYQAAEQTYENELLEELSDAAPWAPIEHFTTLVRESGSEDERTAAQYISDQLTKFGVPHEVYNPPLFLSVPVSASLEYEGKQIRAKAPSFSTVTGPEGLTDEVVFAKVGPPEGTDRIFHFTLQSEVDVRGKIVVCDGCGFPKAVRQFQEAGAIGQIFINPGVDIHWVATFCGSSLDPSRRLRQKKSPNDVRQIFSNWWGWRSTARTTIRMSSPAA